MPLHPAQPSTNLVRLPAVRVVLWLLMLLLSWQLVASTRHHHELAQQADDCASCVIVSDLPSDLPQLAVALQPATAGHYIYHLTSTAADAPQAPRRFLIPYAQAPPAIPLFA